MLSPAKTIAPQDWMTAPATVAVMRALAGDGPEPRALFVGGCVRNTLLGRSVDDIDIATIWTPAEATARLQAAGLNVIPTGIEHGTVTAVADGQPFEITTLRRDVATDGRRAVVAFTDDWAEDAQRRDFTMNTLLADTAGHIYDPTGQGLADLMAGRVVFVGDPAQRIAEDYLRILRFFRFHAFYGRGAMDAAALAACRMAAGKIATLSRERITQEFLRILALDAPVPHLDMMFKNGVLADLVEPRYNPKTLSRLCVLQTAAALSDIPARLAVLAGFSVQHRAILEKYLIFSNAQKQAFDGCLQVFYQITEISEKPLKKLIYKYNKTITIQAVLLFLAESNRQNNALIQNLKIWPQPVFPVSGEDAKQLGLASGPAMGQLLRQTEQWWLDHDFQPGRAACLNKLKESL